MKRMISAIGIFATFVANFAAVAETPEQTSTEIQYDHERRVRDLYSWLALDKVSDDPEYEQITFIYYWFMDAVLGVTIYNRPSLVDEDRNAIANARLKASLVKLANRYDERNGDLSHQRLVTDVYETPISSRDFYSVAASMQKSGFYGEPLWEEGEPEPVHEGYIMICEGPSYFIESRIAEQMNSIGRGGCHDLMADDLDHANALLALAKKKIPPLRNRLAETQRKIRRN